MSVCLRIISKHVNAADSWNPSEILTQKAGAAASVTGFKEWARWHMQVAEGPLWEALIYLLGHAQSVIS